MAHLRFPPQADKFGKAALHVACERGFARVVDVLLAFFERYPGKERSDLLHGVARRSPLQLAARFDFLGIAKNLVAAGARVDHASACDGRTALHVAARFESVAVAQLLVDRGCDLSPRTTCGRALTPLHVSAMHGSSRVAHMLVTRGCNFHGPDRNDPPRRTMTPCDLAIACGHRRMTRNLIEEAQHVRRRRHAELQEIESAYVRKLHRVKKLNRDRLIKLRHLGVAESKCESAARKSRVSHVAQHGGAGRATSAATSEATALLSRGATPYTPKFTASSASSGRRSSTASSANSLMGGGGLAGLHPALLARS